MTQSRTREPLRTDRAAVVRSLTAELRALEGARWGAAGEVLSSGSAALDGLLPERGFRRGALVEWLAAGPAAGAMTLGLNSLRAVLAGGGALVVIDRPRRFYPPAAIALGIPLEQLIVVHPTSDADQAWALDQALRSRGVAAAWCAVDRPDEHTLRRWQLAAETSGVVGFLGRDQRARDEPSWAELRLGVEPIALPAEARATRQRRLRVELLRSRSGPTGGVVELEVPESPVWRSDQQRDLRRASQHETRPVHLAPQLGAATTRRRPRRA